MEPESTRKETIVKVAGWLRGIWEMRRQTGPVQQWIDSIPSPIKSNFAIKNEYQEDRTETAGGSLEPTQPKDIPYPMGTKQPIMTISAPINVPTTTTINTPGLPRLVRDPSLQSDSSHCSSVESLLELRRADPEAILLGLGFGGCSSSPQENGSLSRIPKRFLQPSKLKGIAINDFMKQQQETSESIDSVSLGYRGLTGSPYVAPSEIVQKIMQRLREHESHEHDPYAMYNSYEQYSPVHCSSTQSVLSPDNRQFLEQPRSKSPDMRNKRMIIGQKSFAFGHDGDLIEIHPSDTKTSFESDTRNDYNTISQVSNIVTDKIFEPTTIQKAEGTIRKRLSFYDSTDEFDDSDVQSPTNNEMDNENINTSNKRSDKNINCEGEVLSYAVTENTFDIRRASDGFCNTKHEKEFLVHERRHSDGFVQKHDKESVLTRRRKTLKRQTRVSDLDAIPNAYTSDAVQHNVESEYNLEKDLQSTFVDNRVKLNRDIAEMTESKCEVENSHMEKCFGEKQNSLGPMDDSLSKVKQDSDKGKCCVGEVQSEDQSCEDKEGQTTCCCRSDSKKYWKKMEKIIQENKNLESMVTKSRREMAEIREMLSSVLSVRLEPGF
ncbi:uncharacterized protein LOC108628747 isoform X2 [Ceratina calcarata]|uniref:Uncharacterized protein LOC108628747 isoform X2 n=1 Tax=Ceratina calcarata TaxID=156304 RepID=A0AAJ7J717_9HYME|nr:uncharacterized protein LOC108628747 isoform X2 [Ceratina calcarata]